MDLKELKILLRSSDKRNVTKALMQIRSKEVRSQSGLQHLLDQNFVGLLVPVLEKANPRTLDISLSILANLLQAPAAQLQLRQAGGLAKLLHIVDHIQDRAVLCRGWRALANAAQDRDNLAQLRSVTNMEASLGRALARTEAKDTDMLTVLVRCVRLCCGPEVLRQEAGVADRLVAVLAAEESEAGLVRAVVKCVAKLSRGAALPQVQTLLQAAPRLVALARAASRPDLRDNSLGTLINLSQVDQLRPGLGSAGVVELLVATYRGAGEESGVPGASVVRTLCLYCRESVNRVRMREGGGCAVLVSVLASPEQPAAVRDTVLRSLLQFLYDNHSLNVLMSEGLVPCLVTVLEQDMEDTQMRHECGQSKEDGGNNTLEVEDEKDCDDRCKKDEIDEEALYPNEKTEPQELNLLEDDDDDVEIPKHANHEDVDEIRNKSPAGDGEEAPVPVDPDPGPGPSTAPATPTKTGRPAPVFRITSPSYQAVQYELQQFLQLKSSWERDQLQLEHQGSVSPLWSSSVSPVSGCWSPGPGPGSVSPSSSLCQSPDRTPLPIPLRYSPARSPSPARPQLYSPLLYSPSYDESDVAEPS